MYRVKLFYTKIQKNRLPQVKPTTTDEFITGGDVFEQMRRQKSPLTRSSDSHDSLTEK